MHASLSLVVVALVLFASAPAASQSEDSGVKGRILDVTCYGPCMVDGDDPRPYAGEARIVAKRASNGRRAGSDDVDASRFRIDLAPGRYRVRVKIDDPCWVEDSEEVKVTEDDFDRIRLEVGNGCIQ